MCVQASEAFLQRMVALYASSHYKNTPNDLILMSDAPAHHLFALLGPVDETQVGPLLLPLVCSAGDSVWDFTDSKLALQWQ